MEWLRRREVLAGVGGLGSLVASGILGPDRPVSSSLSLTTDVSDGIWPQYGHDARRSGYTSDPGPTLPLEEQWQVELDRQPEWIRVSGAGPIVGDHHVYALESDALVALDRDTGTEQWRFHPPVVTEPISVRGLGTASLGSGDGPINVGERLAYRDGRVFLEGGQWTEISVLYAIDAESGTMEWAVPGASEPILLGEALLCSMSFDGSNAALINAQTGRIREKFDAFMGYWPGAFVGHDLSIEAIRARTDEFDLSSGYSRFGPELAVPTSADTDIALSQPDFQTPAITTDGLALSAPAQVEDGDTSQYMAVLGLQNGGFQPLQESGLWNTQVVTDNERWYIVGHGAVVSYRVREPGSGDQIKEWETDISEPVGKPAVTDTALYVPIPDGILALDPASGERLAEQGPGVEAAHWEHPAVIAGETLYRRTSDGTLYAYR